MIRGRYFYCRQRDNDLVAVCFAVFPVAVVFLVAEGQSVVGLWVDDLS